jgi:hypothetical protein
VLCAWLFNFDQTDLGPPLDSAERSVLWRLEGKLEQHLIEVLSPNYRELLEDARQRVLAMGPDRDDAVSGMTLSGITLSSSHHTLGRTSAALLGGLRRTFRHRMAAGAWQRRFRATALFSFQQRVKAWIGVDRGGVVLHEAAGIGRGPVGAVQVAAEHAQHGELLTAMMRRVGQSPGHDPGSRSLDIEERRQPLPPLVVRPAKGLEPLFTRVGVPCDEIESGFPGREWRNANVDA